MKQIIFLDNDSAQSRRDFADDIEQTKMTMHGLFKIPDDDIERMEIIDGFYHKLDEPGAKDKFMNLLFDPSNIVATYSMYTASHYGSLYTFLYFVAAAGRNDVKGKVYLNLSSEAYMINALINNINDQKRPLDILKGINNNHFISYSRDTNSLSRCVVDLSNKCGIFKPVPISEDEFLELAK